MEATWPGRLAPAPLELGLAGAEDRAVRVAQEAMVQSPLRLVALAWLVPRDRLAEKARPAP